MEDKTYFERIEEKVKEREKILGRKLTIDEQDELKLQAMAELWVDASAQVKKEQKM